MRLPERKRIGIQILACVAVLGLYLLRYDGAMLLYFELLAVCVLSIFVSTLIESRIRLSGILNSVSANLVMAFIFFAVGSLLSEQLTLEVIESVKPENIESNGPGGPSKVVTAAMIGFGGWEFLMIYTINSVLAYAKYLPEFRKKDDLNELTNVDLKPASNSIDRFSVKQGGKLHFIHFDRIHYIEASGNYINIFSDGKKYTLRESLQEWLQKAGKDNLLRIHRSFVINTNFIKELSSNSDGQYSVILDSGDTVKIGKQYKAELFEFLGLS